MIATENNSISVSSKVVFQELDSWLRDKIQQFIQQILEEEVSELLGRAKSQRRQEVDSSPAYRNGYGKARKLTTGCGTVTLRRPRVRNRRKQSVPFWLRQLFTQALHLIALPGSFPQGLKGFCPSFARICKRPQKAVCLADAIASTAAPRADKELNSKFKGGH